MLYRQYGRDGNKHGLDWQEVGAACDCCQAIVSGQHVITPRQPPTPQCWPVQWRVLPPLPHRVQVAVAIIQDGISHCDSSVLAASTVQVCGAAWVQDRGRCAVRWRSPNGLHGGLYSHF